jgi:2-iminoacetate synthase ThiH
VSENHRTNATKVTTELNTYLEDPVSTNTVQRELHKSTSHCRAVIAKPLIPENNAKRQKDGVMIVKPGCLMIQNT